MINLLNVPFAILPSRENQIWLFMKKLGIMRTDVQEKMWYRVLENEWPPIFPNLSPFNRFPKQSHFWNFDRTSRLFCVRWESQWLSKFQRLLGKWSRWGKICQVGGAIPLLTPFPELSEVRIHPGLFLNCWKLIYWKFLLTYFAYRKKNKNKTFWKNSRTTCSTS